MDHAGELDTALQRADNEGNCLTQEITYYKLTHISEFSSNRQQFMIRGTTFKEKLEDLTNILSSEEHFVVACAGVVL